jgi:hypothetical protein
MTFSRRSFFAALAGIPFLRRLVPKSYRQTVLADPDVVLFTLDSP